MQANYRYPQAAYPYEALVHGNAARGYDQPELELVDTGVFDDDRFFTVTATYAKAEAEDCLIEIEVRNNGPEAASLHCIPTLWFRNTWTWGCRHEGCTLKPSINLTDSGVLRTQHESLESYDLHFDGDPELLGQITIVTVDVFLASMMA